ncbi:MAG: cation-transporting P-type ATPase [Clostridiales bacterium]|nr:cation-transporting P-type ATPase [Candidatus Equinaster intestinalis]
MIWHSTEKTEVINYLESNENEGLTEQKAAELYTAYKSELKKKKPNYLKILVSQFNKYLTLITFVAALVTAGVSIIAASESWILSVSVIAIIVLDTLFDAYQQYYSQKIKYDAKYLLNFSVDVIRNGNKISVNSGELVRGDIILLKAGDLIPADARLLQTVNFRCDEFILTGETVDAEKDADGIFEDITEPAKRKNMVFEGCSVTHGTAKAVVTDLKPYTEYSNLKKIKKTIEKDENAFARVLDFIGKYSLIISGIAAFLFFVLLIIFSISATAGFAELVGESLLNSLGLIITLVPETLPATVTIILWTAVKKLNASNKIRKTSVLENIAGVSVICADKTAVLTPDKMAVKKVFAGDKVIDIDEYGADKTANAVIEMAFICGNSINYGDNSFDAISDSGNSALENYCIKAKGMGIDECKNIYPMESYLPFDSEKKIITSINMINGRHFVISKGAPEEIIKLCANINTEQVLKVFEDMAQDALHIIAIATKPIDSVPAIPSANDLEYGLSFVGLIAFEDIPESASVRAVKDCADIGIRTVMITGDNLYTAKAVARRLGILPDGMAAITGEELRNLSEEELTSTVNGYSVFARVSPEDKYKIIKALRHNNESVAVTGFKNSDAPTLRKADVGFACRSNASPVVCNAADISCEDISLKSICGIISACRDTFFKIKKIIHYFLSCNIGELLAVIFGLLIFSKPILIAPQLLFINFITDVLPAVSLSHSPNDSGEGNGAKEHKKLFSPSAIISIAIQSVLLCVLTLIAYSAGVKISDTCGQAMALCVLGLSQILHMIPNNSDRLIINTKLSNYKIIFPIMLLAAALIVIAVATPVSTVLGLTAASGVVWPKVILLSLIFFAGDELIKLGISLYKKLKK